MAKPIPVEEVVRRAARILAAHRKPARRREPLDEIAAMFRDQQLRPQERIAAAILALHVTHQQQPVLDERIQDLQSCATICNEEAESNWAAIHREQQWRAETASERKGSEDIPRPSRPMTEREWEALRQGCLWTIADDAWSVEDEFEPEFPDLDAAADLERRRAAWSTWIASIHDEARDLLHQFSADPRCPSAIRLRALRLLCADRVRWTFDRLLPEALASARAAQVMAVKALKAYIALQTHPHKKKYLRAYLKRLRVPE